VKKAIAAHSAYTEATFSMLLGETTDARLGQARRAAGVTSNALEALITRALLEPGKQNRDPLEAAMVVDAALRRCAGRSGARCRSAAEDVEDLARLGRQIDASTVGGKD
jgi:hypothetical protein